MADVHKSARIPLEDISVHVTLVTNLNQTTETVKVVTLKEAQSSILTYNPSNIFARARLVQIRHVTEYSPAKTGEYPRIFPNFQNCARCEKDLKNNKHNSLHLGRKYARIFVLGHYLFLEAHSFPRATLSEKLFASRNR